MKIVKSHVDDHTVLTELTIKSKAFWGYSEKQIKDWTTLLTISKKYITENEVYNLISDGQIIAYYSFFKIDDNRVKLDNLFILPSFIGKKLGTYLVDDFILRVKKAGISVITLDSEPNSEDFYRKMGFRVVGQKETSMKNRFMPIMEKEL